MMKQKIFISIKILSIILFFAILLAIFDIDRKETTITLTEKGFAPAGIKIKKGTVVKFINKTNKSFWPASDFHPNHNIYSEFDPKREIVKGDAWKMQFNKIGTFRYHDHITPIYRGTIVVVESGVDSGVDSDWSIGAGYNISDCKIIEDIDSKRGCFSNVLQNIILKKGPDIAFKLVKDLRDVDPDFAAECHTIVHSLGEISYWKYAKDKKLPQTGLISTCGFGYIHGFMQELGHHSPSFVQDVETICNHLSQKINYTGFEQAVNPLDQCYHGVGHGLAYFYLPDNPDNITEVITKGARDCEELVNEETSISNCKYGIFGGISSMYIGSHGIKVNLNEKEPFSICNSQDDALKDACFDSLVPVLGVLWDKDIKRIAKAFSTIDQEYMKQSFYNFGDLNARWIAMGEISSKDVLIVCSTLNRIARQSCLQGLSDGIIRNGFPKDAPYLALGFCQSDFLNQTERKDCELGFLKEMKLVYPDKIESILSEFSETDIEAVCDNSEISEFCNK